MMPDKPELLPCPFCGQMPDVERDGAYMLINCGCKMEPGVFGDPDLAIAAWNARTYPTDVVAALRFYYAYEIRKGSDTTSWCSRLAEHALLTMGLLPTTEEK